MQDGVAGEVNLNIMTKFSPLALIVALPLTASSPSKAQTLSPTEAIQADTARMIAEQGAADKAAENAQKAEQAEMDKATLAAQQKMKNLSAQNQKQSLSTSEKVVAGFQFDVSNPRSRGRESLITEFSVPGALQMDYLSVGSNSNLAEIAAQSGMMGRVLGLISIQNARLIEQND